MKADEVYAQDVEAMTVAALEWSTAHPNAELKFPEPLRIAGFTGVGVFVGPLNEDAIRVLGRNEQTRDLLRTLERAAAAGGGATILQAQAVIEGVFGIDLTLVGGA